MTTLALREQTPISAMAKTTLRPNNTRSMDAEKELTSGPTHDPVECIEFDESLAFSPDAPLDPKALPALGGVYLLSDADERPIFLSVCENLRRVVPPRLASDEPDEHTKRAKLGEIARGISWKRTRGTFEGLLWHWQFARRLFPNRYSSMLGFGPCWLIRVEPDAAFPRFEPVSVIRADGARYFGPLPRRKDAESLVRQLEDAFDLCRYYEILQKTPNGERCAYYDMGRCAAPCDGTVPMATYRTSINEAIELLTNPTEETLDPIRRRMQAAVEVLAFESAAAYKRVLDDMRRLRSRTAFARIVDVGATGWLAIIRASVKRKKTGETLLKGYSFSKGRFRQLATGRAADIEKLGHDWQTAAHAHFGEPIAADPRIDSEALRLLSRFLFKDNQRDVLIYPVTAIPNTEMLMDDLAPLLDTKRRY